METMTDKAELRKSLALMRTGLEASQKAQWDAAICARIVAWWRTGQNGAAGPLGVYWPLRGEPDCASGAHAGAGSRSVLTPETKIAPTMRGDFRLVARAGLEPATPRL